MMTLTFVFAQVPAFPADVQVTILGQVEYNQVRPENSRMGNSKAGDDVTFSFLLNSANFSNSTAFPTRGYSIIADSLSVVIGSETYGIQDPLIGNSPLFILRNNDPKVDGFLIGSSVNGFENGAPLNEEGALGPFKMNFLVTYLHNPLPSLDIFDAIGTYDFDGISSYHHSIDDGAFNPVGIIFKQMIITAITEQAVKIEALDPTSKSFAFFSLDGHYHSVEASSDLEHWMVVGHYSGNDQRIRFQDERGDQGQTQFFRVRTHQEPLLNSMLEKEWHLISMHENDSLIVPKNNRNHTIQFRPDQKIGGRNDCNTYFGGYSLVNGNTLDFGGGIASTKVLCQPDSIDGVFFRALDSVKGFEITYENLTLYYGSESQSRMEFRLRN